eukprot:scaffold2507_cov122-Isochrysis_galbana.AAC.28
MKSRRACTSSSEIWNFCGELSTMLMVSSKSYKHRRDIGGIKSTAAAINVSLHMSDRSGSTERTREWGRRPRRAPCAPPASPTRWSAARRGVRRTSTQTHPSCERHLAPGNKKR